MSEKSSIEWTDTTWNPVTGCTKVSPGCAHCYAETFAERFRGVPGHPFEQGFDLKLWPERLSLPLKWKKPRRVFVNSMSDLFHEDVPFEFIDRVFAVMALTPQHTYQVLTKRPERMREYLSGEVEMRLPVPNSPTLMRPRSQRIWLEAQGVANNNRSKVDFPWSADWAWPLPNCWLGTSVENQHWADVRIPELLATPAAVRFLSCEPLLSELHLEEYLNGSYEVSGGRGIPRGGDGRTDHRRGGSHLAGGSPSGQQMVGRDDDDPVRSPSGRESDRLRLSPSTRDDRLLAGTRAGASAGMAALPRADSSGADHQSQEREPIGQQARQFGTGDYLGAGPSQDPRAGLEARTQLSWVIVGGESGPKARPFDLAWARSLVSQCRAAGVAVFYKQGGKSNRCPHSAKGGCFECIPDDLQIREMPL